MVGGGGAGSPTVVTYIPRLSSPPGGGRLRVGAGVVSYTDQPSDWVTTTPLSVSVVSGPDWCVPTHEETL